MQHFKTVEVPATTKQVHDFDTCDICGIKIDDGGVHGVNEVEVRHKTGQSYPEGGGGEEISVDMCGKCFDEKLLPWLRSLGVVLRTKEWFY